MLHALTCMYVSKYTRENPQPISTPQIGSEDHIEQLKVLECCRVSKTNATMADDEGSQRPITNYARVIRAYGNGLSVE